MDRLISRTDVLRDLRKLAMLPLMLMAALLTGCTGATVAVPQEFPVPLVRAYPLNMGWHLDDALMGYTHKEQIEGSGAFEISLGDAQQPMFQQLSRGLFRSHAFVGDTALPDGTNLHGVLAPSIAELQFSTPRQTRSDYYEVWIRYQFKLYDADGTLRGEWPLTAYGKANKQNYGTGTALQEAAIAACRDAIAYFSLHFHSVPVVKTWLAEQNMGADV